MPALPAAHDATTSQPDSLAPRELHGSNLIARHPGVEYTSNGAIAFDPLSENSFVKRQSANTYPAGIIPTYYNFDGPAPGTVIGIVLGSVAAFLLVVYLLWSLTQLSGGGGRGAIAAEEEIVVRRPRRNSHGARSRRSTRTEVREYSRSPRRSGGGRSQVIVEERRAPPRPRSIIVEDRRVPGDDVVEVIEEHDEYRARRGSRRGGYR